jgi:hypothetical protein
MLDILDYSLVIACHIYAAPCHVTHGRSDRRSATFRSC